MKKDKIKEFLMELALKTRDYEWAAEINKKDYSMTRYYVSTEGLPDEEAEIWRKLLD